MAGEWHLVTCDVCRLLDGDVQPKMCFYCPLCGAWICEADQHNWARRGAASARAMQERFAS